MEESTIQIQVYDKREQMTVNLYVTDLGDNCFRMSENDILNRRLTLGTEFQTRVNESGAHEIIRILKNSLYHATISLEQPIHNRRLSGFGGRDRQKGWLLAGGLRWTGDDQLAA